MAVRAVDQHVEGVWVLPPLRCIVDVVERSQQRMSQSLPGGAPTAVAWQVYFKANSGYKDVLGVAWPVRTDLPKAR